MEYTKENPLRCFFAFEGYNSQGLALNRLKQNYPDFDWVCVGRSEIDKYAIQAADALFPESKDKNFGDISKISWSDVPDFDLFTMSSPCQDFSQAGLQKGGAEGSGTRSSLLWECRRAILAKKPKYIVFENVKALVSQKFLPYFLKWQNELASYGYSNFAKVLNASSYGIPQNRERIFMVSILDENASYHFPEPFPLDKRLKDVLEEEVDEKYYLKPNQIEYIYSTSKNGIKRQGAHEVEDIASAIVSTCYKGDNMNCIKEPIACAMRDREVYRSKHVNNLIKSGKIPADEVAFLDGYNQAVHTDVSATIKTNIDKENLMFVSIPQCLTPKRTEYGKQVRKKYESGKLKESGHNIQHLEPRTDGVCNTITSVQKDNLIVEPIIYQVGNIYQCKGFSNPQIGRIYSPEGISPTIDTAMGGNREPKILSYTRDANGKVVNRHFKDVANTIHGGTGGGGNTDSYVVETGYRIRKLTERDVFRLMDVDDADIDKIHAAGISKSQQYKMAGNSICTGVLFHIFRKLFVDKENENQQLTLF